MLVGACRYDFEDGEAFFDSTLPTFASMPGCLLNKQEKEDKQKGGEVTNTLWPLRPSPLRPSCSYPHKEPKIKCVKKNVTNSLLTRRAPRRNHRKLPMLKITKAEMTLGTTTAIMLCSELPLAFKNLRGSGVLKTEEEYIDVLYVSFQSFKFVFHAFCITFAGSGWQLLTFFYEMNRRFYENQLKSKHTKKRIIQHYVKKWTKHFTGISWKATTNKRIIQHFC